MLCELILYEYLQNPARTNVYKNLFLALLAETGSRRATHVAKGAGNEDPGGNLAFQNFLKILENNFTRNVGVAFYADKMNTSVRNLNNLCSKMFGKSVSEMIETRKLIEARRLMLNSGMTVSEIGYSSGTAKNPTFHGSSGREQGFLPRGTGPGCIPDLPESTTFFS